MVPEDKYLIVNSRHEARLWSGDAWDMMRVNEMSLTECIDQCIHVSAPRNRVRITYLIEQLAPGGAERQLVEFLKRLDPAQFQPRLVTGYVSGFIVDEVKELGIPIATIRGSVGGGKLATLAAIREIRKSKPHIIHSYAFVANTWGLAAHMAVKSSIFIAGARGFAIDLNPLETFLNVRVHRWATHTISNSHAQRDALVGQGVQSNRITVVPNGIDVDRFQVHSEGGHIRESLGLSRDIPLIGMIGAFSARKRWDVFLRAAADVARSRAVSILCVGDGELRGEMQSLAQGLEIGDCTRFTGTRSDIPEILEALDTFVLSSDAEGQPNVVLEAMAAGTPVVATAVSGTPEIIIDGESGSLVPAGDWQKMSQRITELLDDPNQAQDMASKARRRIEQHFSMKRCAEETIGIYRRLLSQ